MTIDVTVCQYCGTPGSKDNPIWGLFCHDIVRCMERGTGFKETAQEKAKKETA